ncbi:hypothetical protein JCM6882_000374 [Rhodosporidiobolus microsporus]
MACFSDLPQELVDYIVELATPSFSTRGWKERYETLKTLHLVNETFLQPARRLLASEIAVDSSSALDALTDLFGGSADEPATKPHFRPKLLMVERTWYSSPQWPSPASKNDRARVLSLVDHARPHVLAVEGFDIEPTRETTSIECLLLSDSILEGPVKWPFNALKRLGLYDVEVVEPARDFIANAFPSLVTLAFGGAHTFSLPLAGGRHFAASESELTLRDDCFPLLQQLRAASLLDTDLVANSPPLLALDSRFTRDTLSHPEYFPSSLQVLRFTIDPYELDRSHNTACLHTLLTSPSFLPTLRELHIVSRSSEHKAAVNAMRGCKDWCRANGVKLFLEQMKNSLESFDLSFWRFLDGVKARLGIDCFSDLPQEVVDYIIKLATPSFDWSHWEARRTTLKSLCLTSWALHRVAKPLLYRDVVLSSPAAIRRLARDPFQPGVRRVLLPFEHIVLLFAVGPGKMGSKTQLSLSALFRQNKLHDVVVTDTLKLDLEDLQEADSVFFDGNSFDGTLLLKPVTSQHHFPYLRRLALRNLAADASALSFTSKTFPSLVALDVYEVVMRTDDGPADWGRLELHRNNIHLIDRLQAAAVYDLETLGEGFNCKVLCLYDFSHLRAPEDASIPPCVEVLRLNDMLNDSEDVLAKALFPPDLKEVHLADVRMSREEEQRVRTICAKKGVKLFCETKEFDSGFNQGFWRFLDGIKDRLGLDV